MSSDQQTPTVNRAMRLARAGRSDAARIVLMRALAADPDNADGWALLARLEYDLQDPSRTIHALEQVVRIQPDNVRAQEHLHYLTGRSFSPTTVPLPEPVEEAEAVIEQGQPIRKRHPLSTALRVAVLIGGAGILLILLAPYIPPLQRALDVLRGTPAQTADNSDTTSQGGGLTSGISPFTINISRQIGRLLSGSNATTITVPTPRPTPRGGVMINYDELQQTLEEHVQNTAIRNGYDFGVSFVDIETGQVVSVNGDQRFHAMSTFKGPLAVQYFWLLERGMLAAEPGDREHMMEMLEVSANSDTSCIFERVGGIAAFNDWLALEGFSRDKNFVLKWDDWSCNDPGQQYIPATDWRYSRGDEVLGLPGGSTLLACPIPQMPCDKAFTPAELALFYARLYRGEVISPAYRDMLLPMMIEGPEESIFWYGLPDDAQAVVYIKGGIYEQTEEYRENFVNEAGIIETPYGAFALAVFMQQNPDFPGSYPISETARIVYEAFVHAHSGGR